jgi:bifunctional non-homologous end joining protein LigD
MLTFKEALLTRYCQRELSEKKEKDNDSDLVFVVQKHKATSLHYDFRLQIGEVMPSWSIPKGPTLDSKVKRLALVTGDHDLEYRHFEGIIPRGDYGAGIVMVWDEGTYRPEIEFEKGVRYEVTNVSEAQKVAAKGLKDGNLKFRLYGKKLQGSFALVRTRGFQDRDSWLLIKHRDEFSKEGYDAKDYDVSAVSGLSLDQIAKKNNILTADSLDRFS